MQILKGNCLSTYQSNIILISKHYVKLMVVQPIFYFFVKFVVSKYSLDMELEQDTFEIKLIEQGLHKGYFTTRKARYDFASLKKKGNYIEIEYKSRWSTLNCAYKWMGKNLNAFPIELRYKDGKTYIVRMS